MTGKQNPDIGEFVGIRLSKDGKYILHAIADFSGQGMPKVVNELNVVAEAVITWEGDPSAIQTIEEDGEIHYGIPVDLNINTRKIGLFLSKIRPIVKAKQLGKEGLKVDIAKDPDIQKAIAEVLEECKKLENEEAN